MVPGRELRLEQLSARGLLLCSTGGREQPRAHQGWDPGPGPSPTARCSPSRAGPPAASARPQSTGSGAGARPCRAPRPPLGLQLSACPQQRVSGCADTERPGGFPGLGAHITAVMAMAGTGRALEAEMLRKQAGGPAAPLMLTASVLPAPLRSRLTLLPCSYPRGTKGGRCGGSLRCRHAGPCSVPPAQPLVLGWGLWAGPGALGWRVMGIAAAPLEREQTEKLGVWEQRAGFNW